MFSTCFFIFLFFIFAFLKKISISPVSIFPVPHFSLVFSFFHCFMLVLFFLLQIFFFLKKNSLFPFMFSFSFSCSFSCSLSFSFLGCSKSDFFWRQLLHDFLEHFSEKVHFFEPSREVPFEASFPVFLLFFRFFISFFFHFPIF